MRNRWLTAAALLLVTIAGTFTAVSASASDPGSLGSGHVTDEAGVLSSTELAEAEARLTELQQQSDLDLFVVFVDEFTNPSDAQDWSDAVAEANGLGDRDYLLAVAVEQRNYAFNASTSGPISASEQNSIERAIENRLGADDWGGAIIAAADEMQGDGGTGFWLGVLVVVGILVLVMAIVLIVRAVKRARLRAAERARGAMPATPDPNDPFSTLTDDEVEAQAGTALVQADDALTSSREELGFAIAQFGEEATAGFTAVIDSARQKMSQAFDLKQKLDDEIEDTVFERRAWHIQIIQLCDQIDDELDENTEAFDELRSLQQNAPAELERVRRERAALTELLPTAAPALQALTAQYDAQALATVQSNPQHAAERADLADRAIDAAAQAIAAGETGKAAFSIRTAEQSVAQAAQLVQAVTELGPQLTELEQGAQALIAELQRDLAAAGELPDDGTLAAAIAAVSEQVRQAQANLQGSGRSPQRMLDALTAANTQIDTAISQGQERLQRARRQTQLLAQTIAQANSEIRMAQSFIQTNRGSIGSVARTRVSQAEASLAQAVSLQATDEAAALSEADRALNLARQATAQARGDVSSYSSQSWGDWGSGPFGGSSNDSGLAGDILGGIIGGLLSGGGGGRRSSGGWRSSGGIRSSGFGGGRSSGSIGRSSGGSRRSGGGRF